MIQLKIKEIASSKGLLLKDICEKAGYKSLPSFYRQINNPESINMKTLIRIANVMGCEVADFFTGVSKPEEPPTVCPHCGKPITIKTEIV